MVDQPVSQPKPVTDWWKPELVELPKLTFRRRLFRRFFRATTKVIAFFTMRVKVRGLENFPAKGPAIIAFNHLGDWDSILLAAVIPISAECIGKIELNEHWLAGPALRAYGCIWIHRGQPDRRAVRAALDALSQGRMLVIAPEGRQVASGGLEEGTEGAAFLAMKSGAQIVPVALTGTENDHVNEHLKKWKRIPASLSVGKPFLIQNHADRQAMIRNGTRQIMESLARLLPPERRGQYSYVSSDTNME
jgi:1-acyl-sn-glycerol-3-phosphate acyltransferase